jgi:hypothetical protein
MQRSMSAPQIVGLVHAVISITDAVAASLTRPRELVRQMKRALNGELQDVPVARRKQPLLSSSLEGTDKQYQLVGFV